MVKTFKDQNELEEFIDKLYDKHTSKYKHDEGNVDKYGFILELMEHLVNVVEFTEN